MLRTLTFTAVAALMTGPVMADGVNYARLSYDFTNIGNDDFDDDVSLLQGGVEYTTGQFLLGADLQYVDTELEGIIESQALSYALSGAYMITPEVLVGLGLNGTDVEIETDLGDFEGDANGFEVFGQYQTSDFGVGVNVVSFDSDEDNLNTTIYGEFSAASAVTLAGFASVDSEDEDNGGSEGTDYYLSGDYEAGDVFARAYIAGNTDADAGIFGVRGHYDFAPQIRATASFATRTGDDASDVSFFTVGGGYEVVDGLWADANIGIVDGDDVAEDITRLQVALTYEIGDRKRLDRRLEQDAIDDVQSAGAFGFF